MINSNLLLSLSTDMMSLCRNHMVLLLFLSTLLSFSSHPFTQADATSRPITQRQFVIATFGGSNDDDDDDDHENWRTPEPEVKVSVKKPFLHQEPPQLCPDNPCLEDQPPCNDLSKKTGCLCPGVSGSSKPPLAPRIHDLLQVKEGPDSGKVAVQWCAPPSDVFRYRVTIEGNESPLEFKDTKRRGLVGYLEVGTKVCVEAVNNAGHSSPSEFSCKRYEPSTTFDHSLMVGVLAGAVILLLLIIIGTVVFCKYRLCQRTKRDANDGLGNPSYNAAGTL